MKNRVKLKIKGELLVVLQNAEMQTVKGYTKTIYQNRSHKSILSKFSEILSYVKYCEILKSHRDGGYRNTRHLLYANIKAEKFREITNSWNKYRKVLVECGVLEVLKNKEGKEIFCIGDENGKGGFPKAYRINPRYNNESNLEVLCPFEEELPLDALQIDSEKALRCLKYLKQQKRWNDTVVLNMKTMLEAFDHTPHDDFVKSRTGREFNKVNLMQCNLREYITWDGEETVELDYCAAAISSLFPIINDDEKEDFRKFLGGDIYQVIGGILGYKNRRAIKTAICVWIGSNRSDQYTENINQFFMEFFPLTFADWDEQEVNIMEYTQGIESLIVCEKLKGRGISIHDALLCKKKDADELKALMIQYMKEVTTTDTHEGITIQVKENEKENLHSKGIPPFSLPINKKTKREKFWKEHNAQIDLYLEKQLQLRAS